MEALVTNDILRRAGVSVKTVGVCSKNVKSAFNTKVETEISENEIVLSEIEAVILPGGMPGAANLRGSKAVMSAVDYALKNNKLIAAICAAPGVVLKGTGVLKDKKYTCYPGYECGEGEYTAAKTEKDGNLITGNGPAAAAEFACRIVSELCPEKAKMISDVFL